jgi:probable F420-dependent oxidoreductase
MKLIAQLPLAAASHIERWDGTGGLADMAVAAESAGFDALAVTEHPFPDDEFLAAGGHHAFDPFVALSFAAAATGSIRLMTAVTVSGYRNPYLLAKSVATLDAMSGGRFTLGIAAGYLASEFEVLGGVFADRRQRFNAALQAMIAAWGGTSVHHDSDYFPAHGRTMLPRPQQTPYPPIWIGGNSKVAIARSVEFGEGWMPWPATAAYSAITESPAITSLHTLAERIVVAQDARAAAGKPPLDVAFIPIGTTSVDAEPLSWDLVAEQVPDYERSGVTWLNLELKSASLADTILEIESMGRTFH